MPFRTTWRSRSKATRSRDRPDRPDPQDVSASRGLRRTRQGAVPGPDQLPRASRGDPRARLQRGLRIPQLARAWPSSPRSLLQGEEAHADGHRRRAGSDPDRDHHHCRELRRHQPLTPPRWRRRGLRCVFAESIRDSENVAGPMSPEGLAKSEAPRFSPKLRDEGMQRINDLFSDVARRESGTHQRVPGRRARRDLIARAAAGRPRLRRETRSRIHDPPVAEPRRSRFHGAAPRPSSAGVSRRSTASSARGCSRRTAATSTTPISRCSADPARSCRTRRRWPRTAASSRPSPRCERRAAPSPTAPTTTPTTCSR